MKYLFVFLVVSTCAFADMSQEVLSQAMRENWTFEFHIPTMQHAKGFVKNPKLRAHAKYAGIKPLTDLPAHFDLLSRLTPVKDQGSCGGCWAFAIVGAIENFPYVQPPITPDFSEQNMLDCDSQSSGCGGGDFDGFDFAEQSGLASEQRYPFSGGNGACQSIPPEAKVVAWQFVSGSEDSEPSVDQIKTALFQTQAPITVGIHAGLELEAYNSGIINSCTGLGGLNHMVDIVGWDDTDQDWIVRNSWGSSWGENGYFRILREKSSGAKCQQIGTEAAFVSNATFVNQ